MSSGKVKTLVNAKIIGTIWNGLEIQTRDGRPAQLAIIDEAGKVIESGRDVEREIWNTVLQVHCNYLQQTGYLTVHSTPPGLPRPQPQSEQKPVVGTQDTQRKGQGKA